MRYEIELPKIIRCARGCRRELAAMLPSGAVLILSGHHAKKRIESELLPQLNGRKVEIISDITPEPPLETIETARLAARAIAAKSIIGWGGGSAIDSAKATAALLDNPASVADCFYGRAEVKPRQVFFAAVPTTAGTAAEITANAVLIDPATEIKQSLRGPDMYADAALIDAELLEEAPLQVLAASGFDALTQGIEGFIARKADTLTREFSRAGTIFMWNALHHLALGKLSAPQYDNLARGSMLAGMGFARSGLGAAHGIGHPCGSCRHIPHGVACAVLLPGVLRFNREVPALAELAIAVTGNPDVDGFIVEIERLRSGLGLPKNFRSYGFSRADFPFVLTNCRSGSMKNNPRNYSDADVAALLETII